MQKRDFTKISDVLWEIPKSFRSDMRVPARVYTTEKMLESIVKDRSTEQLVNVATRPGSRSTRNARLRQSLRRDRSRRRGL